MTYRKQRNDVWNLWHLSPIGPGPAPGCCWCFVHSCFLPLPSCSSGLLGTCSLIHPFILGLVFHRCQLSGRPSSEDQLSKTQAPLKRSRHQPHLDFKPQCCPPGWEAARAPDRQGSPLVALADMILGFEGSGTLHCPVSSSGKQFSSLPPLYLALALSPLLSRAAVVCSLDALPPTSVYLTHYSPCGQLCPPDAHCYCLCSPLMKNRSVVAGIRVW